MEPVHDDTEPRAEWTAALSQRTAISGSPAFVRLVNAVIGCASVTISLDGTPTVVDFATATEFRLVPPGDHYVDVDGTGLPISCEAAGRYEVVSVGGGGSVTQIVVLPIPDDRAPDGAAAVRVVNAIRDLDVVAVDIAGSAIDVVRYSAGPYIGVASVALSVKVGTGPDNVFLESNAKLERDTTYTVLLTGGGEQPPRASVIVDGTQVHAPPPPGTPVETGDRSATPTDKPKDTRSPRPERRAPGLGRRTLLLAAVVTAIGGTGCAERLRRPRREEPGKPPTSTSSSGSQANDTTTTEPGSQPRTPVSLTAESIEIPSIGVSADVVPVSTADLPALHLSRDGRPVLPKPVAGIVTELTTAQAITLVGHNTPRQDLPAVFEHLPDVVPDAEILVSGPDRDHLFTATQSSETPKGQLATALWSPVPSGIMRCVLITCSGGRDSEGLRTHNWVVVGHGRLTTAAS